MFGLKPLLGLEPIAPIRPQLLVSHANHSATETSMYLYMCVCVYVFAYVCMYVCMYVYIYIYIYMYVSMYWCMTTSMYCLLYVGFDYTYIDVNALAQGIKSFLASHVWSQAVAGARTYGTDSPAITSQPR